VIDLHLHTTASDGQSAPAALVDEAAAAGLAIIAVTDHDTVAALAEVRVAASVAGLDLVPGIEVTAVAGDRDLHILGYFIDERHVGLAAFLTEQRADRRRRIAEILERLSDLGVHLAPADVFGREAPGRAIGRPAVARALVASGHAADINDAFLRYLGDGGSAFVPRRGASPETVIALIVDAGGVASIAHPGKSNRDDLLPTLAARGLGGVEAFHPDHSEADVARYRAFAEHAGLAVTGGSDYHGPGSGRASALGQVTLPEACYAELRQRAGRG